MEKLIQEKLGKYFPNISEDQEQKIIALHDLYREWNEKVNLISRKDIDQVFNHHILHSLSIAKFISFAPKTKVLDLGTGGGLPGLPLAILFPESTFHLVDARAKKIFVLNDMINRLNLQNASAEHNRVESLQISVDYVVSRAVAKVSTLLEWSKKHLSNKHKNVLPNGFILLKGGDLTKELKEAKVNRFAEVYDITSFIEEEYFDEKKLVYIQK